MVEKVFSIPERLEDFCKCKKTNTIAGFWFIGREDKARTLDLDLLHLKRPF